MNLIKEDQYGKINFNLYENIGFAISCMLMNSNYSLYHVKTLQLWTIEAIRHEQFKILFDYLDKPIGYITWAYFSYETLERFVNNKKFFPHSSEWNEGGNLCILDFCCCPGTGKICIDYLKNTSPIVNSENVIWLSRKNRQIITYRKIQ